MRNTLTLTLSLILIAVAAGSLARPTPSAAQPPTRIYLPLLSTENIAAQVLDLVNVERLRAGCAALILDARLSTAARSHSDDMAAQNFFSHQGSNGSRVWDRIESAGYQWRNVGENIAAGQTSPAQVMSAWMNSSGHRANILDCDYTHMGLGYVYQAGDQPLPGYSFPFFHYWTQVFAAPQG